MKKTTAAAAAGAVALTATGAVSALFMTMGAAQSPAAASTEPVVLTEYVDQNGNPVEAPGTTGFEMPEIVVVDGPAADPIVTTEYVDTYVTAGASGEALASDGHAYDDDLEDDRPRTTYRQLYRVTFGCFRRLSRTFAITLFSIQSAPSAVTHGAPIECATLE